MRLEGGEVTENEVILKNIGRVRDVACNPYDGCLYVILNGPRNVIRLVPAK
jgi:glucose/arabinose dehydrogenase